MAIFNLKRTILSSFLLLFACGLQAQPSPRTVPPTHIELRGSDLPQAKQGYLLPAQDVSAAPMIERTLHALSKGGKVHTTTILFQNFAHSTIARCAPCLSIIAHGQRSKVSEAAIKEQLCYYIRDYTDTYDLIRLADYWAVELLLEAALEVAPEKVSWENIEGFEELPKTASFYRTLCDRFCKANYPNLLQSPTTRTLQGNTTTTIETLKLSHDGSILAVVSPDQSVHLWDTATGDLRYSLQGHTETNLPIAFSSDSSTLATGSRNCAARIWDVATGNLRHTLYGHREKISRITFSPDGKTLATSANGSSDRTVRLWNIATGEFIRTIGHIHQGDPVKWVKFSPDGNTIAICRDDHMLQSISFWTTATATYLYTLEYPTGSVFFSPDSNTIVAYKNKVINIFDTATGERIFTLPIEKYYEYGIRTAAFSPDGSVCTVALSSFFADAAFTFNPRTGGFLCWLDDERFRRINFAPDGKTITTNSSDFSDIRDAATGKLLHRMEIPDHPYGSTIVTLSSDCSTVVSCLQFSKKSVEEDQKVHIWRLDPNRVDNRTLTQLLAVKTLKKMQAGKFVEGAPSAEELKVLSLPALQQRSTFTRWRQAVTGTFSRLFSHDARAQTQERS